MVRRPAPTTLAAPNLPHHQKVEARVEVGDGGGVKAVPDWKAGPGLVAAALTLRASESDEESSELNRIPTNSITNLVAYCQNQADVQ